MADLEDIRRECLLESFVRFDNGLPLDYGELFLYFFTFIGLIGSLVIILSSRKYIQTNSGFGYLILSMSICDFFVSLTWLIANFVDNLNDYRHCLDDTRYSRWENFMIDNIFSINDMFLLASSFLGLAVAYIAIAVLYLNALTNKLKWKKLVSLSFGVSTLFWIFIISVHSLKFFWRKCLKQLNLEELPAVQDLIIGAVAASVVILSIALYLITSRAMVNIAHRSTFLMLSMIQAITISNIICWIPLIIYRVSLAITYITMTWESKALYYAIFYLYTATAPAKGFYHLVSLWLSEWYLSRKMQLGLKAGVDTINWTISKEKTPNTRVSDLTL